MKSERLLRIPSHRMAIGMLLTCMLVGCAKQVKESFVGADDRQEIKSNKTGLDREKPNNKDGQSNQVVRERDIDLMPLLDVRIQKKAIAENFYVGGYTRFYLDDETTNGSDSNTLKGTDRRKYADEHRRVLSRIVAGRELSRVLSVKMTMKNPALVSAATLASASYSSTFSKGESWTTEVNSRVFLTPYFRVDSNGLAKLEISINASASSKDQVSSKILPLLQGALQLAAPGSALLTSLNAPRFTQASQFADGALSSLFTQAIVERSSNEYEPSLWFSSEGLAEISARFPLDTAIVQSSGRPIGTWTIKAAPPIISIFSVVPVKPSDASADWDKNGEGASNQAKRAFQQLSPQYVLSFPVAENLSLKGALLSDNGVAAAMDAIKRLSGDATATSAATQRSSGSMSEKLIDDVRELCNRIDEKAQALGLNRFDAAATVWAFSFGADLSSKEGVALRDSRNRCAAAELASAVGLNEGTRAMTR